MFFTKVEIFFKSFMEFLKITTLYNKNDLLTFKT
jgi:hypothetical protein